MPPEPALPGLAVQWDAPPNVRAFMTTREGGVSTGRFSSLNLGAHVGDDPHAVARNRQRLMEQLKARPAWLHQVHGAEVVSADAVVAGGSGPADAAVTITPGIACCVLVADCLPVLFAARNGRAVAAAHAGWRGLAGGVLENSLRTVAQAADCAVGDVMAWLGPCIGPQAFEVGDEVREAFGSSGQSHFATHVRSDGSSAWLADLPALARQRLQSAGMREISGGTWCTVGDASAFFSYRRDGVTGRLAAAVCLSR